MNKLEENVLDPVQENNCPEIFEKGLMKKKVKGTILDPIYKWLDKYKFPYEDYVKSVSLIGSSAGYQYNKTSDVDVSIETSIPVDTIKKIWRELPNGNNLPDSKHPVNYYLTSDKKDVEESENAYDIINDVWIKKQDRKDIEKSIPFSYIMEVAKGILSGIDDRIQEYETDNIELDYLKSLSSKDIGYSKEEIDALISQKENEIKSDLDAINVQHQLVKSFRKEAFENDNPTETMLDIKIVSKNSSLNNAVYKMLEKCKYFEKFEKYEEIRKNMIEKKS